MSRHLDRLRRGERWWAAEFVLRTLGLALLAGCYQLALLARRLVTIPPPHQATPGEFAVCLGIVLLLTSGLALTLFGPGAVRGSVDSIPQLLVLEGTLNARSRLAGPAGRPFHPHPRIHSSLRKSLRLLT